MSTSYFISHTPTAITPNVPVDQWQLSELGQQQAAEAAALPWIADVQRFISSTEPKAIETARILIGARDLQLQTDPMLGENDRSSTGYLPKTEFEITSDKFFSRPEQSVLGWERAIDAQRRIIAAIRRLAALSSVTTAYVSHGAVGSLLLADLLGRPISRRLDQSREGSFYAFDADSWQAAGGWHAL